MMYLERENLNILFRLTNPETILESIRIQEPLNDNLLVEANRYDPVSYEHFALGPLKEFSTEEIGLRYRALNRAEKINKYTIFITIVEYADKVLYRIGREPVCKSEQILNFNECSKRLGQDLIVTAWLAWHDIQEGNTPNWDFLWPATLNTDDAKLKKILKRGVAENHFHLNGSTQSFALSWACLMNHPSQIGEYLSEDDRFRDNLSPGFSRGSRDNIMNWNDRLRYAAFIRAKLMKFFIGETQSIDARRLSLNFEAGLLNDIGDEIEGLRLLFGVKFEQSNRVKKCLDYACSNNMYPVDEAAANRLLAGERSFLYWGFYKIFMGEMSKEAASLFYVYILIKSQFRGEMIQSNERRGFANFAKYQDRKSQCFERLPEYLEEAYRLGVVAPYRRKNHCSLEARIMPADTKEAMRNNIRKIDKAVYFADMKAEDEQWPFYYVIHFPKKQFDRNDVGNSTISLRPRNYITRTKSKIKAYALNDYVNIYEKYIVDDGEKTIPQRVMGIDACSFEIGCRPETFATEFRYLRHNSRKRAEFTWYRKPREDYADLKITYHVGEDFLDIIDGLRAIDETLLFLELQKGDRLGHAIALGLDAYDYYNFKHKDFYLPKQDYLDNLVWMLYRSLELGIEINAHHRAILTEKAITLLYEIYGGTRGPLGDEIQQQPSESLDIYYFSWKLRGDHPQLYSEGKYSEEKGLIGASEYYQSMKNDLGPQMYRDMDSVCRYLYYYHFDRKVKLAGLEPGHMELTDKQWYIDLVVKFQEKLREEIAAKGISIECNPTSNYLISTFGRYDKHPILKFNRYRLEADSVAVNIPASINTDDLGVFDTSLENEYALMLEAIKRARSAAGINSMDEVYDYLDNIRECGKAMAFR